MKLYQLRRAIRLHGDFYGRWGTAAQWGAVINATARHIYDSWKPLQNFPIQSLNMPDHGYPVCLAEMEPLTVRALEVGDSVPTIPEPRRITITPTQIKYGDGDYHNVRVVYGVQDFRFFIWELGGLTVAEPD